MKTQDIVESFREGASLREMARDLGKSHETVRLMLIDSLGKDEYDKILAERRAQEAQESLPVRGICEMCRGPNTRAWSTCSPQCAEDMRIVRYVLKPEQRETRQELQGRDTVTPRQRYVVRGSAVHEVLARHNLLEELGIEVHG